MRPHFPIHSLRRLAGVLPRSLRLAEQGEVQRRPRQRLSEVDVEMLLFVEPHELGSGLSRDQRLVEDPQVRLQLLDGAQPCV